MTTTKERRDKMIGVKCTAAEYERIRVAAFEARKSLGAYVREIVLAPKTKTTKTVK